MKDKARESFKKALLKENLNDIGIDVLSLSDYDLKKLYLKLQLSKSYKLRYFVPKEEKDFLNCLINDKLCYVSFRNTPGIRRMNFKEFLLFDEYCKTNSSKYVNYFRSC